MNPNRRPNNETQLLTEPGKSHRAATARRRFLRHGIPKSNSKKKKPLAGSYRRGRRGRLTSVRTPKTSPADWLDAASYATSAGSASKKRSTLVHAFTDHAQR